jgi:hypothetical protein
MYERYIAFQFNFLSLLYRLNMNTFLLSRSEDQNIHKHTPYCLESGASIIIIIVGFETNAGSTKFRYTESVAMPKAQPLCR